MSWGAPAYVLDNTQKSTKNLCVHIIFLGGASCRGGGVRSWIRIWPSKRRGVVMLYQKRRPGSTLRHVSLEDRRFLRTSSDIALRRLVRGQLKVRGWKTGISTFVFSARTEHRPLSEGFYSPRAVTRSNNRRNSIRLSSGDGSGGRFDSEEYSSS